MHETEKGTRYKVQGTRKTKGTRDKTQEIAEF